MNETKNKNLFLLRPSLYLIILLPLPDYNILRFVGVAVYFHFILFFFSVSSSSYSFYVSLLLLFIYLCECGSLVHDTYTLVNILKNCLAAFFHSFALWMMLKDWTKAQVNTQTAFGYCFCCCSALSYNICYSVLHIYSFVSVLNVNLTYNTSTEIHKYVKYINWCNIYIQCTIVCVIWYSFSSVCSAVICCSYLCVCALFVEHILLLLLVLFFFFFFSKEKMWQQQEKLAEPQYKKRIKNRHTWLYWILEKRQERREKKN